jgi:hypothetical protein
VEIEYMRIPARSLVIAGLTVLAALVAAGAGALTYLPVSDPSLVDRADVILRGTVASRWVGNEPGRVMTSYVFDAARILKGDSLGSPLVVRVPGGIDLDEGLAVKIFGTPEFAVGDSALLFLSASPDGTYRVLHVFQGAFAERREAGRRTYERPGTDAFEVRPVDSKSGAKRNSTAISIQRAAPAPRDAPLFEQWISDRLNGVERRADYFLPETRRENAPVVAQFTYLSGSNVVFRWFEFDDGGKLRWHRHSDGQEGFSGGGAREFKKARKAWKRKFSRVPIKLANAGTTSSAVGFTVSDGRNTVLHRDLNDTIGEDFECPGGGVLAIGGVSAYDLLFTQWKGLSTLAAHEAEIIMNDGIDCFVKGDSDILGQIYAHELGHTLGLGHSCGDSASPKCRKSDLLADALMAASLEQVFGPEIHDDDILAIRQLYDEEFWAAACANKVPGSPKFCRRCGPCGEGQGNCRTDSDCFGSLVCTRDIGAGFGFDADVNVCTEP